MAELDPSLVMRIDRLERGNRRLRLVVGLLSLAGGVLLMGARRTTPLMIDAESFAVVDKDGNRVAALEWNETSGGPNLELYDPMGNVGVRLGLREQGAGNFTPGLSFYGPDGNATVIMIGGTEGSAMGVRHGGASVLISASRETSGVTVYDTSGEIVWESPGSDMRGMVDRSVQRAFAASMRSDLRNLAVAQESYFADHITYTATMDSASYRTSQGVTVEMITASGAGWSARASHNRTDIVCSIFIGDARPVPPAAVMGQVACTE